MMPKLQKKKSIFYDIIVLFLILKIIRIRICDKIERVR